MAVDERRRRHLFERLDEVLGPPAAEALMEELGSLGRDQLATRHDMQLGFASVRQEMADLRGDLRQEMAELRGETRQGMASLRTEMADLRADLMQAMTTQTRQLGTWMLGTMLTLSALVLAASTL